MNKIKFSSLTMKDDFIVINNDKTKVVFSTAEKERNFNRHNEEGVNNLNELKKEFGVDEVIYIRQVHSDNIFIYDGKCREDFLELEGDAIVTNKKNIAIGVFTADCVPVILVDEEKGVVAAIHSGWKGTYSSITYKTIDRFINDFGSNVKDIKAYIGPHIRKCCYEISEELKNKFLENNDIEEKDAFSGRNLSMETYIINDLRKHGIIEENINSINLCTHCSEDIKLFSYRKSKGAYGRLFSFVIVK